MDDELTLGVTARELADIAKTQVGHNIKANWTGAWDRCRVAEVGIAQVNVGKGFEDALAIASKSLEKGYMLYIGPYVVTSLPTDEWMLLFTCRDALYMEVPKKL